MISTPGDRSAIRHGWSNHCFRNPVKPALHGRGLLSAADPMQWHSVVVKRNHTAQPGSFLQVFPNLTGSCPLLLSYLADCSCPASHRTDRICGPLHWLLCLLPQTWWEALRARTDSYHVPLTLFWFWAVMTSLWQTIPTLVVCTLLPLAQLIWRYLFSQCRTGAAGSSLNEQKHGSSISHTKASNTLQKTAVLPSPHNKNIMCSFQLGKEEKSFT